MIATNFCLSNHLDYGSASSGTVTYEAEKTFTVDEADYTLTVDADFDRFYEGHDRAAWIRQCRREQLRRLGLLAGKYWRDAKTATIVGGQRQPRRIGLYSGFCSRNRGRHWDRRRR